MEHRTLRQETIDNALLAGESDDENKEPEPPLAEAKLSVSSSQVEEACRSRSRGLDPDVKKKLLLSLDEHGGFHAVSYDNRLLATVCDNNVKDFGSPNGHSPRRRRKQCQNFIQRLREMDMDQQNAARIRLLSNSTALVSTFKSQGTTKSNRRKVVARRRPKKLEQPKTAAANVESFISPIKSSSNTMPPRTNSRIGSRNSNFSLDGSKPITVDLTRPENHFPMKVFPFTNAHVNGNKHMISGVDIKYRAHIADVCNDRVKASIGGENGNIVKVELPLLDHVELQEYDKMLSMMQQLKVHNDVIQDQEQTNMMELLENEDRHTHSFYFDFGTELITETMVADGSTNVVGEEIDYFVVPLDTQHKVGKKVFNHHTCEVTWRVGFASTLRAKHKKLKTKGKGSAKVASLISGMSSLGI